MPRSIDEKALIAQLEEMAEANFTEALTRACLVVEADAKRRCPVGDGQLRASIVSQVAGNTGTVGTNLEYAPYVEIGTGIWAGTEPINGAANYHEQYIGTGRQEPWSYQDEQGEWHTTIGQQPQPFLFPALYENKEEILKKIKEGLIK